MIFKEFDRAKIESPLERIVSLASIRKIPGILDKQGYPRPQTLGLESLTSIREDVVVV